MRRCANGVPYLDTYVVSLRLSPIAFQQHAAFTIAASMEVSVVTNGLDGARGRRTKPRCVRFDHIHQRIDIEYAEATQSLHAKQTKH